MSEFFFGLAVGMWISFFISLYLRGGDEKEDKPNE